MNTGCVSRAPGEALKRDAESRKSKRDPEGQTRAGAGHTGPGPPGGVEGDGQWFVQTRPGPGKVTEQGRAPQGEERCRGRRQSNVLR